jgi:anaerobic selenocysteine-containing dehydrogenase
MAEKQHVRGACPMDCPDTCSWIVTVKDGRAVKLEGDRAHPFTRGALCNKLNDYIPYTQSPERLLYPMRRIGPKEGGSFARISWDEALAEISARLLKISEEFGAEAIWPYVGTGNLGLIQGIYGAGQRFWNALGASRHVVTICTRTAAAADCHLAPAPGTDAALALGLRWGRKQSEVMRQMTEYECRWERRCVG